MPISFPTLINVDTQEPYSAQPNGAPLQAILSRLSAQSSQLYNDLVAAMTASPYLANELNLAANSGALEQIRYAPTGTQYQNAGGFQTISKTIWIGQNFLTKLQQNNANLTDALVFVFGHEAYHALDAQTLSTYKESVIAPALITALQAGTDVTSILVAYAQVLMADEANGNLEGWNALISTLQTNAPTITQLESLYSLTSYSQFIINSTGTPLRGIGLARNGAAPSAANGILSPNTQAEANAYEGQSGGFARNPYSLVEPARALNFASQLVAGAVINVNLKTLMKSLGGSYSSSSKDPFAALAGLGYLAGSINGQRNEVNVHDTSSNATGSITYDPTTARLAIYTTLPGKTLFHFDYLPVANQSPAGGPNVELSLDALGSALQFEDISGNLQIDGQNLGGIFVGNNLLTGTGSISGAYSWMDGNGDQYSFSPAAGFAQSGLGTLQITGSQVTADSLSEITVDNFSLTNAESAAGEMGIYLNGTLSLSFGTTPGVGGPVPSFVEGSARSYTLAVNAPSTTAQTVTVTLSGAIPSDFQATVGNTVEQLNNNGTFNVLLAAGETSVTFGLVDTTADNGTSDIATGATLQLTASLPNLANPNGPAIQTAPLSFSYIPTPSNSGPAPQNLNTIAGTLSGGVTDYVGDGGNDYIAAGAGPNFINATNSVNDSILGGSGANTLYGGSGSNVISLAGSQDYVSLGNGFNTLSGGSGKDTIYANNATALISGNNGTDIIIAGNGTNAIYAGVQTSLTTAIATASSGTATGQQGDLIAVGDGSNTIVGGNGNDLIVAGAGNDVIVMGPGSDTFEGGLEVTSASANWNTTFTPPNGSQGANLLDNNVNSYVEYFSNSFQQPYNGTVATGTQTPYGPASDTIYGGTGNEVLDLGNGNNYVQTGSGNDFVLGGMGNDTIIVGSGSDFVRGGGGTTYIEGGSGTSTLIGGDGNNTILGGTGNTTITSANGPVANWTNQSLEQNYVNGGSGNDLIFGSGGADTLIAGTGNTTVQGGSGTENIVGGSGNDYLVGGTGSDTLAAGGAGRDTLSANGSSSSTSYLYGGSGQDNISGGSGANILYAGDGGTAGAATSVFASQSDAAATTTIYGGLGVDLLEGGAGSSVIYAGDGGTSAAPTTIIGGSGNDTLYGGLGTDLVQGGTAAAEVLYAGDGGTSTAPTTVLSGSGTDTLYGGAGASEIQDQRSGQDLLVSGTANDSMTGIGNDTLVAGTGNDVLQANSGSVNFEFNPGFGNDTIYANGGTENLLFGPGILATDFAASVTFDGFGNNYLNLYGDGGSIVMQNALTGALASAVYIDPSTIPLQTLFTDVFGGDQTIAAGSNNFFVNLANGESVTAGAYNDTISSWGSSSTLQGGSGFYTDLIYSSGASAVIRSGFFFDSINASGNNDSIYGGNYGDAITVAGANSTATVGFAQGAGTTTITDSGANDTLIAGLGSSNANFIVNNATTVIQVSSGAGVDTVTASVSYTAPTNVNVLTLAGSANIAATGNAASDTLTGGAGADTLIAGAGLATLLGGTGNTTFVVNSTSDVVQDTSTTTSNSLQSSVSYVLPTNVNNLVLTGTAALTGTANSGNDTISSNTGIDTLIGGTGNDTFILYNVADVVQDTAGTATIVYALGSNFTLPTGVNTLTLLGTSSLVATGNAGNDSLTANLGADTLIAGNGNDTLVSGAGSAIDSLVGGTGNDLFVVNNAADAVTVGSTHGVDTIQASVSYTAAANVANLTLIGSGNLAGTGNTLANVITANSGSDTLIAGTGVATLIGGAGSDTFVVNSASDVIQNASALSSNTLQSSISNTLIANVNTLVLTGTSNLTGTANSGTDTLIANTGVDTLVGGAGNDTFVVSNSGDVVQDTSTTAVNSIVSSVNYVLPTNVNSLTLTGTAALVGTGNAANDLLTANSGADTLVAGSGNDTLVSGIAVADSLVGGAGTDLFIVNNAGDVVSVGGHSGVDSILASVSFTLPTLVTALTLTGSANLTGAAVSGNNSITGNAGNDVLQAGSGADTLIAGSGIDTLIGGAGNDFFVINNTADVLQSLSNLGNSVISSVSYTMPTNVVALTLTGTANLQATGNAQTDQITGNAGNDTVTAGTGNMIFYAGAGRDVFIVNSASDQMSAPLVGLAYASDTIESSVSYTLSASANNLLLTGTANLSGTGNNIGASFAGDLIVGNAGLDTLTAGAGVDTLVAGTGLATLVGAAGTDTFVVNNVGDVVQDSVSGFSNLIVSSVNYTLPTNVNAILLTGSANIQATGNAANDSMTGGAGADTLIAGNGNDTLVAGAGLATLVAGTGNDTFVVNSSADLIQNASAGSQNAVFSSATFVLPTNVNQLTLTGVANISGTGNGAADTLKGGAGNDTLIAGSGLATLIGGLGNTTFVVNSTSDVVQDASSAFSDTIQSSATYSLVANVNNLVLTGTSALSGTANAGNDTLTSNTGVDTLVGGAGNDTFVINNTSDVVQDTATSATNTAQSSVNYALAANVNTLVLTGTAALQGTANSGADTLVSNAGVDTLVGGSGNDTFVINNSGDVVQDSSATATNLIQSSVNFTLPTNVNALTLTGTSALSATGNAAANIITANTGNDTLSAGSGVATLIGGVGNETFVVNSASDVVQDTVTSASNTLQSSVSVTLMANVNTLVLTGTSNLTGTASSANDTLVSNSGIDTLVGGSGRDLFIVNNSADVIQNATANDTIESSVNYVLPSTINNLILIGTANISGTGNASSDTLTAAGSGNDTLTAGSGVATLIGGAGNETFVVNSTSDVVQDTSTTASNTILSSVSYSLPTNVDSLTLTGSSALTATGNLDGANVLTANAGNDVLVGTAFSNTLNGGSGSDTIDAGPESNIIYSGTGGTTSQLTIVYGNASGTNITTQSTIYGGSGANLLVGGPGSDLIYGGSGTVSIQGGSGFDTIYGGSGVENLSAGSGSDSIYGAAGDVLSDPLSGTSLLVAGAGAETLSGIGADTLMAGSGADFLYDSIVGTTSTVYEFAPGFGQDTIGNGGLFNSTTPNAATNASLLFASGIAPSSLTISQGIDGSWGFSTNIALVINDGASAVSVNGGLTPGVIGGVNFAGGPSETLTQFMNSFAPSTTSIQFAGPNSLSVLSVGNSQTVTDATGIDRFIWSFGNSDVVTESFAADQVFAYGNNDTITSSSAVWAGGNNDSVTLGGNVGATLAGAADTLVTSNSGVGFVVHQSSDVIQVGAGATADSIDAFANYTLPTNVSMLTLDSTVGGLSGSSNSQGGMLIAGANADTLTGGAGRDTLKASGSNDVLVGGAGSEAYILNNVTDSIQFGSGAASLNSVQAAFSYALTSAANALTITGGYATGTGNAANDWLAAQGTYDTLIAGSGNDTLVDSTSTPTALVGGSGNDTFIVNNASDVIQDTASAATNTIIASVNVVLPTNINNLTLTGAYLTGTANAGNDSLTANGGNDTLIAGVGNDTLVAASGTDTFELNSGFGHDQIIGAQNGALIQFGSGILQSSLTFSALPGTNGAAPSLVITGAGGAVTVQGGLVPGAIGGVSFTGGGTATVAQLVAPSGRTTVTGSNGNLILSPGNSDSVTAGVGQDTIIAWGNTDTLVAGSGGTVIDAGGTGDQVRGSSGSDTLNAIGANTTLIGGSGNETFLVNTASTVIQVSAGVGHDTVFSAVSYTVPTNVSQLTLTGTSNLVATGNAGNDTITANAGNDTIIAGSGVDTLVGGTGIDIFQVNNPSDVVQVTSGNPQDQILATSNYTLPSSVNNLQLNLSGIVGTGNAQADYMIASASGDTVIAGSGNDTEVGNSYSENLMGGSGNDYLISNGGSSNLTSGTGINTLYSYYQYDNLYINNSADVIGSLANYDTLYTSVSFTFPANVHSSSYTAMNWYMTGSANVNVNGQNFLSGLTLFDLGSGNNTMVGNAGAAFNPGAGIDTFIGNVGGSNSFTVNKATDVVIAPLGSTFDTLSSSVSYTLPAYVDTLKLTGASVVGTGNSDNDTMRAYGTGDTLVAGSGNDSLVSNGHAVLIAGSGNDTLKSLGTNDTLIAGSGNDLLVPTAGEILVLNAGFGNSQVSYSTVGTPVTVQIGAGLIGANLTASAVLDANSNAALAIGNGTGTVTLDGALANETYQFDFNGGSTLTLGQFLSQVNVTTSSVTGASGNLTLTGAASTSFALGSGSDTIYASGSNDTLAAGTGASQLLYGGGANDSLTGGSGASQTLTASGATSTLKGGNGTTQTVTAAGLNETVIGGSGTNQTLRALGANDWIIGGSGTGDTLSAAGTNDTLVASSAASYLYDSSLLGNNSVTFMVNSGSDTVGAAYLYNTDTISSSVSFTLPNNLHTLILTGTANLTATGNPTNNNYTATLVSNTGVDTLSSNWAANFYVNNSADVVVANATYASQNRIYSGVSYTLPSNFEGLFLTGTGLTATGNSQNGWELDAYGADTLVAGSGDEALFSNIGFGTNTLVAGSGNDFLDAYAGDTVEFNSGFGHAEVYDDFGGTGPTIRFGSGITGSSLTATAIVDLNGNGALAISNTTGAVTLDGSLSNTTYQLNFNGAGNLTLAQFLAQVHVATSSITGASGNVILEGTASVSVMGGTGNDTIYAGATADTIRGGSGNQVLTAVGTNDSIVGGSNNDTLSALGTNDTLVAGAAVDTLVGGSGVNVTFVINNANDAIQLLTGPGNDTVSASINFTLPTNINSLILTGTAALVGTANAGNDSLTANSGADTLVSGTTGTDSLVGGSGNDTFYVNNTADKVTDTSSTANNTLYSTVTYTLPTNVNTLILTGNGALVGTGNTHTDSITAGSGVDTLVAGTGVATLIGGSGNDTFVINSAADVITDTSTTTSNTISSTVTYTLPTNVNALIFTGTSALKATGNSGNDSITANTGADTLVAGSGIDTLVSGTTGTDSLVGGTGNDIFFVNVAADKVTDTVTTTSNTISSIVSYTLPTNVNTLIFTGTAALQGTANGGNDLITANTGADTLVAAGAGNDTLVSGSIGTDSLVGGTGNDTFVVNNTADKVTDTSATASNTIVSSVSYTLPTDVQYLTLTGTSALAGTGNNLLDLIVGNTGSDTLTAGTGIAALEGGRTAGSDQIKALSNQAALIAGGGSSTLTGGAFKDFYAAGLVSDSITTGATANVVSINKGDGATALAPTTSATNILSLGAGIDTESLFFTKTGNNLILTDAVSGDSITFTNWYVGSADQDYTKLQVVEIASANYNSGGGDILRNKALEAFNFTGLVAAFNAAGSPANWALSTNMASAQLTSTSTADYGGDLAYYFGLNGNLTGVNLSAVQSTLTNASFGTATQTIDSFGSITVGGGLHLMVVKPGVSIQPVAPAVSTSSAVTPAVQSSTDAAAYARPIISGFHARRTIEPVMTGATDGVPIAATAVSSTLRRDREVAERGDAINTGSYSLVTASNAATVIAGLKTRRTGEPVMSGSSDGPTSKSFVDPINVAWLTMHGALEDINAAHISGAESGPEHDEIATDALLGSAPLSRIRRTIGAPDINSPLARQRAL
jgi:Ca2+-binding RTX toxin-like protein